MFVESCIICIIFVIERRRDKMFNNGEMFYYLSRNVARQQKIIEMYMVFLRYNEWASSVIVWKQTVVLFYRIVVAKISCYRRVIESVHVCHCEE